MAIVTTKKPRRSVSPGSITSVVQQPTTGVVKKPKVAAGGSVAAVAQPKPVAPAAIATPALAVKPIEMPSATASRVDARKQYGLAMGDVNRQLQELARQFGGANQITQYGYSASADPRSEGVDSASLLGVTPNDPNSMLATIARNLQNQQKFVDQTHEADNTFFSGLRLTDQDKASGDATRAQTQAKTDYESAVANLVSQLTGARNSRNAAIGGANATDDEATAAAIAAAKAQAAANPPSAAPPAHQTYNPATPGSAPLPAGWGFATGATWNPKGYFEKPDQGGVWHIYPDGRKVFVRK